METVQIPLLSAVAAVVIAVVGIAVLKFLKRKIEEYL